MLITRSLRTGSFSARALRPHFFRNVYWKMRDDEFPARLKREFIAGGMTIVAVLLAAAVLHYFIS
jgi:hypothetical protein